jgi:hypothetical protein
VAVRLTTLFRVLGLEGRLGASSVDVDEGIAGDVVLVVVVEGMAGDIDESALEGQSRSSIRLPIRRTSEGSVINAADIPLVAPALSQGLGGDTVAMRPDLTASR